MFYSSSFQLSPASIQHRIIPLSLLKLLHSFFHRDSNKSSWFKVGFFKTVVHTILHRFLQLPSLPVPIGRCVCWRTWASSAATTCPRFQRRRGPSFSWSRPRRTCETWPSSVWRSTRGRPSSCLSGPSGCASSDPSCSTTTPERPAWTWTTRRLVPLLIRRRCRSVGGKPTFDRKGQLTKSVEESNRGAPSLIQSSRPSFTWELSFYALYIYIYMNIYILKCIYIYILKCIYIYIYPEMYIQDCLRKLEYCDKVLYFL